MAARAVTLDELVHPEGLAAGALCRLAWQLCLTLARRGPGRPIALNDVALSPNQELMVRKDVGVDVGALAMLLCTLATGRPDGDTSSIDPLAATVVELVRKTAPEKLADLGEKMRKLEEQSGDGPKLLAAAMQRAIDAPPPTGPRIAEAPRSGFGDDVVDHAAAARARIAQANTPLELDLGARHVVRDRPIEDTRHLWYPAQKRDWSWLKRIVGVVAQLAVLGGGYMLWQHVNRDDDRSALEQADDAVGDALRRRETPKCWTGARDQVLVYENARGDDVVARHPEDVPMAWLRKARCMTMDAR